MAFARLLVCVDGSRASLAAARTGIDLAQKLNASLRAVYVIERGGLDGAPEAGMLQRLRLSASAMLTRIGGEAAERGLVYEQMPLEGVPFEVILEEARRWNADVIVMGRTGRTGPGRALLGSEAERVLEFSDRPVLIVPTTEDGRAGSP